MNLHLVEISAEVAPGHHAVLLLDQAGWHMSARLRVPANISLLALPPGMAEVMAETLARTRRQSVIWLSFQECTGCTESLTRSHAPTLENMIFDMISLDYHHTLQAASGYGAEKSREDAIQQFFGKYLLLTKTDDFLQRGTRGKILAQRLSRIQLAKSAGGNVPQSAVLFHQKPGVDGFFCRF